MSALIAAIVSSSPTVSVVVRRTTTIRIHQPWLPTLLGGLIGGLVGFLGIAIVATAREYWTYRRAGFSDPLWEMTATYKKDAPPIDIWFAQFNLQRAQSAPPGDISPLGIMQCIVVNPDGTVATVKPIPQGGTGQWTTAIFQSATQGRYQVAWYGSTGHWRPRFYEVGRGEVTFVGPAHLVKVAPLTSQSRAAN